MLLELTVENIAIIDRAVLSLGPGFTALTGETGAGKSLLVDAIGLALGGRADSDLVRAGARKGVVSLQVDLAANPGGLAACGRLGVDLEDGKLVIHREVSAEGRSTVRLNGRVAPVAALKAVGEQIVDLHGQHDHQSLLVPERQVDFLDAWIGPEAADLRTRVADAWAEVEATKRRLATLRGSRREREQRLDLLRFQIAEIEAAAPKPGEGEALGATISRLQNAERLALAVGAALSGLVETEGAAIERVGAAGKELDHLARLDPELEEPVEALRQARYALDEAVRLLGAYADAIEADPTRLEEAAARLDLLHRLRRKYGEDEQGVLDYLAAAGRELDELAEGEAGEEETSALLLAQSERLRALAGDLTALRSRWAEAFGIKVNEQIRDLAMSKASFEAAVEPKPLDSDGADRVEFRFTANPGEPLRPLSKVASGGELSRVMLAIKVAGAGRAGVPTLIFDEVDVGLSGKAAAVTARKLEELAGSYQVLVISHLPQIAGRASAHYRIEKQEHGGRAVTRLRRLEGGERVEEIARLLAGEEVGASALANARELLGG